MGGPRSPIFGDSLRPSEAISTPGLGYPTDMSAPAVDDGGLICGFRLGPVESFDIDALKPESQAAAGARPLWLHFNLADVRARRWIQDESKIDPAAIRALLEPDPRVHLETFAEGTVVVLSDLHHDFNRDPEGIGKIRIFVDAQRVITVRRQRLQTADRLRRDLMRGGVDVASPAALFEAFLVRLGEAFGNVITHMADEIDNVEDEILAGRYQKHGTVLGRVRRTIARLRRHINADRGALNAMRGHLPEWLEAEQGRLRSALGRLDTISQDLELVQERTRLLQEEIAARMGETTNRNLAVLSTVTTALLPITLITGIFGMNVGGLPGVDDPRGFRWVMLVILVTVVIALVAILRRRGTRN